MKKMLMLVSLLLIAGCEETEQERVSREQWRIAQTVVPVAKSVAPAARSDDRITVRRIGLVTDNLAYNGARGVYVINDSETGKEYIGVSGIGITETGSHKSGKATAQDER